MLLMIHRRICATQLEGDSAVNREESAMGVGVATQANRKQFEVIHFNVQYTAISCHFATTVLYYDALFLVIGICSLLHKA